MNETSFLVRVLTARSITVLALALCGADAQPANDFFANRTMLPVGSNLTVSGSSVGATSEPGEPYHAGDSASHSVWWSWTAPAAGTVTVDTAGSDFDTVLAVYLGLSVSTLTEVASNDDDLEGTDFTSRLQFDAVAGQAYQIAIDGFGGDSGEVRLHILLGPVVPPRPAPAWTLSDPYGQTVRSADFAGKVVILDFWATWCSPCKDEIPDLVALYERYGADGLVVVGADVPWDGETAQIVRNFRNLFTPRIDYPLVMAEDSTLRAYGPIDAIPTTFIIDRQNLIRKKFVGAQSQLSLESQILPLLYRNLCLTMESSGNGVALRWPATVATFQLESCSNPASGIWAKWLSPAELVNGTNTIRVITTDAARYFRLRIAP